MNKEIKEKFPKWCEDSNTKYSLLLSDDVDSFMCYILQKELFGREIECFINVNYQKANWNSYGKQMLYGTKPALDWDKIVGLDIALEKTKCWDNHVIRISKEDKVNPNSANLNSIMNICRVNYKYKFVVSSFITMLSYYDFDLSSWNMEQLAILCAIDGLYEPFVNQSFKEIGRKNLALLGYDFLADFIERNIDYIKAIETKLILKQGKIWINENGNLETNIDLLSLELIFMDIFKCCFNLPNMQFRELKTYKSKYIRLQENSTYNKDDLNVKNRLVNFALTYKGRGVVSYDMD